MDLPNMSCECIAKKKVLFQVRKNPSDRKGVFLSETVQDYARFLAVFFAAGFLATTFFFGAAFFTAFLTVFFAAAFFFAAIKIFFITYTFGNECSKNEATDKK